MEILKKSEIKSLREELLAQQNYKCAITGKDLSLKRAVLDHCHKTGEIRGVIDRGVNILLGKVESNLSINGIKNEELPLLLKQMAEYVIKDHHDVIHPLSAPKKEKKIIQERCWKKAIEKARTMLVKTPTYGTGVFTKEKEKFFEKIRMDPIFYK